MGAVADWYILGERESDCFFCRKSQESDDAKNHVVIHARTCFALLNTYPYKAGHLMVAPYKHTGDLDVLGETARWAEVSLVEDVENCVEIQAQFG